MTTTNYKLPSEIPFTTAASDFQKLLVTGSEYQNKEALIDYAATDFGALRDSLISYMKSVYPTDFQNYNESDFAMMFTELVAYMGSIMSFKADALANECFLPTSQNRNNVRKLLELIGISMKGPTSAGGSAELVLASAATDVVTIDAPSRVFQISSPLDGGQVSYTIYKTVNGTLNGITSNSAALEFSLSESEDGSNTTWKNIAMIEGALVDQTGSFTTTDVLKKIQLTKGPVIENSIQVFVNSTEATSGAYEQVDNLYYASGSTNKVFQVAYDELYNAIVLFGDGTTGAAPPPDSTYRVLYRIGGGTRGNLVGNSVAAVITTSQGNATITNSSVVTGGAEAESVENAKKYGPLVFKQQDRLVTLSDYNAYVNRYISPTGGSAIGTVATRKAFSSANIIDLYVLQKATPTQLQRATLEYKNNILSSMKDKKMITDEVVVADGLIRTLDLVTTIYIDAAFADTEEQVKGQAAEVIMKYLSYSRFGFGTPLVTQDLARLLYDINSIRYSTIDNIEGTITVDFNEVIQLNNLTINVAYL